MGDLTFSKSITAGFYASTIRKNNFWKLRIY